MLLVWFGVDLDANKQLPGQDVAWVIIQHGGQIKPAPANHLQIGEERSTRSMISRFSEALYLAFLALSFFFVTIVPLLSYDEPKHSLIQISCFVQLSLMANTQLLGWFHSAPWSRIVSAANQVLAECRVWSFPAIGHARNRHSASH